MIKSPTRRDGLSKRDNMLHCEMKTAAIMYILRPLINHGIDDYCDTGTKVAEPSAAAYAKLLPFLSFSRYPIGLPEGLSL
ncbi:hypothetical protein BDV39DRAFT_175246 [Aspergillus sergii]|uniref:Uncharacterized protein n=1 Tax=Aspergillus sergii TaxID=1034303 RepID=A0A5N6X2U4_9EURO|nr:hypothetical protein BDV39DRAFT_175246 [Aspergillus sergii]